MSLNILLLRSRRAGRSSLAHITGVNVSATMVEMTTETAMVTVN